MRKIQSIKGMAHAIIINNNVYHRKTGDLLTTCCGAYSTFSDSELCCRVCYEPASMLVGEEDERLTDEVLSQHIAAEMINTVI